LEFTHAGVNFSRGEALRGVMSIIPQLLLEGHSVRSLKNSYWKTTLRGGYGFGFGYGYGNGEGYGFGDGEGAGRGEGDGDGFGRGRGVGGGSVAGDGDGYTEDQTTYIVEE
jgi:hypothetical protein